MKWTKHLKKKCEVCHTSSELSIHHKVPRRLKTDNSKSNCATLCKHCHSILHFLETERNAEYLKYNRRLKDDIFLRKMYEKSEEYKRLRELERRKRRNDIYGIPIDEKKVRVY